ncbi:hypothetical protein HXX76_001979 [Chlamydomonas incerta]|uniref:Uncharacterized protein n=1 Tax=Chlamydomonas incerta TaxID=51695 RepID=A0A835WA73_CHLIN|nr:hypothetical protein HXX76_001979 [Chlamydomonas incerta]|eukprot:KAG2443629.1 hypothetical protein HXX76_001979 [Chlamydomonas incerta]
MAAELEACSQDEKEKIKTIWLHAIYGVMAQQNASWAEIGAMMVELGKVAVSADLSKLRDTKPVVKVEKVAVEEELEHGEDMALAAVEQQAVAAPGKEAKKAMKAADALIANVKGGKAGAAKAGAAKAGAAKAGGKENKGKAEKVGKKKGKAKELAAEEPAAEEPAAEEPAKKRRKT